MKNNLTIVSFQLVFSLKVVIHSLKKLSSNDTYIHMQNISMRRAFKTTVWKQRQSALYSVSLAIEDY